MSIQITYNMLRKDVSRIGSFSTLSFAEKQDYKKTANAVYVEEMLDEPASALHAVRKREE